MIPPSLREQLGRDSERLACRFLSSRGYRIEATNVRFRVGEIDIVARDGDTLCFVEVRATSSSQWGGALGSITDQKRRRLMRAARWYLARLTDLPPETRFDVVAVEWENGRPRPELLQDAFQVD